MTRSFRFLSLLAVSTLAVMSTYACSDSSDDKPGGGLLGDGGQIGPEDDSGTGGRPGATSRIGGKCLRDADCGGQGLVCMTADSSDLGGGGPPGGLCVADCAGEPEACQRLDPNSVCVRFTSSMTGPAYCLEGCTVGATASASAKCHDRQDMACDDSGGSTPGDGFCRPTCRNDDDCPDRKCDLSSGFCVDASEITGTLPIGSPCDPDADPDPCNGLCLPLEEGENPPGMCGALCSLGNVGCGIDVNATELPNVACLFAATTADDADLGDLGLCGRLCNCDDDCPAYQRVCRPWPNPADEEASGFKGYCGGAVDVNGDPTEHIACTGRPDAGGTPDSGGSGTPDSGGPPPVSDASAD